MRVPASVRTAAQRDAIAQYYRGIAPEQEADAQGLRDLTKQLAEIKPETVPIMRELPPDKRRVTKIQHRGNFLVLGKEVQAGTPAAFPPLPKGAPLNRLTLARWLVDDNNPLTAAGDCQSLLGADLRHRHRRHERRFRLARRSAGPSRVARLAGDRVGPLEMGYQGAGAAAGHFGRLSAVVADHAGTRSARSRQSAAGSRAAVPLVGRSVARSGAGR